MIQLMMLMDKIDCAASAFSETCECLRRERTEWGFCARVSKHQRIGVNLLESYRRQYIHTYIQDKKELGNIEILVLLNSLLAFLLP